MGVPAVPDLEAVADAFLVEQVGEVLVLAEALVIPAGGEHVAGAAVAVEVPAVVEVGQVLGGGVEVGIAVRVAVEEKAHVEGAAHREEAGKDVWPAEGDVDRVVTAEGAAEGDEPLGPVVLADEWNDLFEDVAFVLDVAGDAPAWGHVAVVPALAVDRVDAEELELAAVDLIGDGADHAALFELEEAAA